MTDYKNLKANDWWYQDVYPVGKKLDILNYDYEDKRVVDLGCNIGLVGNYVLERDAKRYTGVDINEDYINEAKKRNPQNEFILADACEYLEENSRQFNVVIALGFFHHVSDGEVERMLRFKKDYIFEVPVVREGGLQEWADYNVRSREWYIERVGECEVYESKMPLDPTYPFDRLIFLAEKL